MKQYILYLNLPDSYCQIFLPTENNRKYELELSASLDALEAQLGSRFVRTHRSYLTNLSMIDYLNTDGIYIKNHEECIPIRAKSLNKISRKLRELARQRNAL